MRQDRQLRLDFEVPLEAVYTPDTIFENADQELIERLSEDRRIERKRSSYSGESLAKYFSMWANTHPEGGLVVLGMKNDGGFDGCASLSSEQINRVENVSHVFCPDARSSSRRVKVVNDRGEDDFIILFRIHYHPSVVVKLTNGKAYVRWGADCHEMTADEIRELAIDKGQVSFEEELCVLEYPQDFNVELVRSWAASVREHMDSGHDLGDTEILANRHLGKFEGGSFRPNNACALIFSNDPRAIFPGSRVRFLRFEGEEEGTGERYNAVKDIWVEGAIPHVIRRSQEVVAEQLRTFSPLNSSGQFELVAEYPRVAWYEAIVNACVHRSYGNGMRNINVFIRMFDDRLEIDSPGPFPPSVTPQNIYQMHKPRNPRIMEAMYFLGTVRMNREGTRRMRDTMNEMGLPEPVFMQEQIGHALVRVTLKNNIHQRKVWIDRDVSDIVGEAIAASLTEDQRRVLNFIAERGRVKVNDVVRAIGLSWQRSYNLLLDLWQRGILQYVRFRPFERNNRDPNAFFRLRTSEPLPKGSHEPNGLPS